MSREDGGSAFPGLHPSAECRYKDEGMTLRDYFAAKAMQGMVAKCLGTEVKDIELAAAAYMIAGAMMEARKK